jgi:hypothetical protein
VFQIGEITKLRRVDERASVVDFEIVMHPDISAKCIIHADPEARATWAKTRWLSRAGRKLLTIMVGERGFEPPTPLVPNQVPSPIETY